MEREGERRGGGENKSEWKDELAPRMQNANPHDRGNVTGMRARYQKTDFPVHNTKQIVGRGLCGGLEGRLGGRRETGLSLPCEGRLDFC